MLTATTAEMTSGRYAPLAPIHSAHLALNQPDIEHKDKNSAKPRAGFEPRPVGERTHPLPVACQVDQRDDGERQLKAEYHLAQEDELITSCVSR